MAIFAGIAGLISILVGACVSRRLYTLSKRTSAVPERLLAIAFVGLFGVGYPLAAISRAPGLDLTHQGSLLYALGTIGMVVGTIAFSRFPVVVFRPDARWANWISVFVSLTSIVSGFGCAIIVAHSKTRAEMVSGIEPWAIGLMLSVATPFLWNGIESSLYHRNMKRRLALGLAQPVTTHRLLLWAIASWCTVAPIAMTIAIRAAGHPVLAPIPMALLAVCSLINSTCWGLAFFMPDFYRAMVVGDDDTLVDESVFRD